MFFSICLFFFLYINQLIVVIKYFKILLNLYIYMLVKIFLLQNLKNVNSGARNVVIIIIFYVHNMIFIRNVIIIIIIIYFFIVGLKNS